MLDEKVINIKLKNLKDLGRFAYSLISTGQTSYIIHYKKSGKNIYGILMIFRDYYKYYGIPMFYYISLDKPIEGTYLLVKVDDTGEIVKPSKSSRPGWIHIPIIELEKEPIFLDVKNDEEK